MNRAMETARPDDGVIVVNPEVIKEMDVNQTIEENTDREDELAGFYAELFGQNPTIESTYL